MEMFRSVEYSNRLALRLKEQSDAFFKTAKELKTLALANYTPPAVGDIVVVPTTGERFLVKENVSGRFLCFDTMGPEGIVSVDYVAAEARFDDSLFWVNDGWGFYVDILHKSNAPKERPVTESLDGDLKDIEKDVPGVSVEASE
jgi:hypothetical protein